MYRDDKRIYPDDVLAMVCTCRRIIVNAMGELLLTENEFTCFMISKFEL